MTIDMLDDQGFVIHPHASDLEYVRSVQSVTKNSNAVDGNNLTCCFKPWGFEYVCLRNEHFDMWELILNPRSRTSAHIHARKDVLVIVLKGAMDLKTTGEIERLRPREFRVIKRGTLHQILNNTSQPARILEIESPPDKNDLIRVHDNYGRVGLPYTHSKERPNKMGADVIVNTFFQKAKKSNDVFHLFDLTPTLMHVEESAKIFGIICREEISPEKPEGLETLRGQISACQLNSLFVIQGSLDIQSSLPTVVNRGIGCTIDESEKLLGASGDAIFIGW